MRHRTPGRLQNFTSATARIGTLASGENAGGRDAAEVMMTVKDLRDRGIAIRSLREGIATSNATGRMITGVLASLVELELELGRERRAAAKTARKARDLPIGRPKALAPEQVAVARRMRDNGEPVPTIAATFGVSRATVYRMLADDEQKAS